jgi:hypothetical protein
LGGTKALISNLYKTEQILFSHLSSIVVKGFAYPIPPTFGRTAPVNLDMAFMSRLTHGEAPSNHVSVGSVRPPSPSDAETIGTLLYAADRALYAMKAKRPGSRLSAHSPYSFSGDSNAEFHEIRE